jgi:hypothetical protein
MGGSFTSNTSISRFLSLYLFFLEVTAAQSLGKTVEVASIKTRRMVFHKKSTSIVDLEWIIY